MLNVPDTLIDVINGVITLPLSWCLVPITRNIEQLKYISMSFVQMNTVNIFYCFLEESYMTMLTAAEKKIREFKATV